MKRFELTILILALAIVAACNGDAPAADDDRAATTAVESDPEAAIDSVLDELVAAWNRDDLAGHIAGYSDSATYTTSRGLDVGHAAIERNMQYFVTPDGLAGTLAFDDVLVRMLGADHALATGAFLVEDVRDTSDIRGRFTLVLERDSTGWRVLHDHSS
jgi:ketosteroid isomerase-like protein